MMRIRITDRQMAEGMLWGMVATIVVAMLIFVFGAIAR